MTIMMKYIYLIFGIIFIILFIYLLVIDINEIKLIINSINSGTIILEKNIKENLKLKNMNYQINGSYKNRIELFLNINSNIYHKNNDDLIPDYYYSFNLYQEDENNEKIKLLGIISSDTNSTINTRYNLSQSTSFNNNIFKSNLKFKVFLYNFSSLKKTNYKLNFIIKPDDKYNSDLIQCKLIIKENVKDINLFKDIIKAVIFAFLGFIFFILSIILISIFIYKILKK